MAKSLSNKLSNMVKQAYNLYWKTLLQTVNVLYENIKLSTYLQRAYYQWVPTFLNKPAIHRKAWPALQLDGHCLCCLWVQTSITSILPAAFILLLLLLCISDSLHGMYIMYHVYAMHVLCVCVCVCGGTMPVDLTTIVMCDKPSWAYSLPTQTVILLILTTVACLFGRKETCATIRAYTF